MFRSVRFRVRSVWSLSLLLSLAAAAHAQTAAGASAISCVVFDPDGNVVVGVTRNTP
jgi:hypothetical protein